MTTDTGTADAPTSTPLDALSAVVAPLVAEHGPLVGAERLTGGMFATTYRLTFADGERVVAKTAPTETHRLMQYERGILGTEELVYRLAADRPDLLMPTVLLSDTSRAHLATDVLVVSHLGGAPWHALPELTPEQRDTVHRRLGAYMTRLHTVTGDVFGYPASPALQAATWPDALSVMLAAALDDATVWDVALPAERLRAAFARHHDALAEVTTPHLVHTDLWEGNVFLDPQTLELTGVIDTERAVWGDPLLELVGASQTGIDGPPATIAQGYLDAGGTLGTTEATTPADLTAADVRIRLYRCYMYCLLVVEPSPRAYDGDWVDGYRTELRGKLDATLDVLLG